ncbi:MAG: VOC family protein [Pseudohongiellaceae bacterium]|nr:VOC family protein [Pseudohongiellaceae bacterium]
MKKSKFECIRVIIAAYMLFMAGIVSSDDALPALSEEQRPIRISGVGIRVSDLETSLKFYTEVLGLKVGARIPREGPAHEYLLSATGSVRDATLVVIREGEVVPGASEFGNIVIVVPNGKAMAERVAAAGYTPDKIVEGTNFIRDPDGYKIELYQRP